MNALPLPCKMPLSPRRIAIFRALYLGDLLLAVPALRAIRRRFPEAEVTLISLPWAASFVQRFHCYVDRFVEFVGYPGINEVAFDRERTVRFLDEQHHYGYDLAIQMHGSGRTSNSFVIALSSRITAGYYEETPPRQLTLSAVYPRDSHEILRNLRLAALLGCSDLDTRLEFPLYNEDWSEAAGLLRLLPWAKRPWIGIHAGAHAPARRWPPAYFAAVADALAQRFDAQIFLTGSHGEESNVQAVAEHMKAPSINLVSKTSLGGLAALIRQLDLFVSNDTGPAHIATAVDTPGVTLFGPTDYIRWAPLDQNWHRGLRRPVVCSPCGYWECPIDSRCLRWLEPSGVIEAAQDLLIRKSFACNA